MEPRQRDMLTHYQLVAKCDLQKYFWTAILYGTGHISLIGASIFNSISN